MSDNFIVVGDRVRVEFWAGKDDLCGVVVYVASSTMDSWIIRTEDRVFYIQHFAAISKQIRKAETDV